MISMEEISKQSKAVEFIIWVSIIQLLQELQLFETSFMPENDESNSNKIHNFQEKKIWGQSAANLWQRDST
jgi:hypothetical protein